MDVLIFAGQSNMQGQCESRPIIKPIENAYEYLKSYNSFVPLNHPVGEDIYSDNGEYLFGQASAKNGNLVPAFCKAYLKNSNANKVVAIHVAKGATNISQWQKGSERFDAMINKINSGIEEAKKIDYIDKIYFVWFQGESDSVATTTTKEYFNFLTKFKNDLKEQIPIDKFCIIKVGYFASTATWVPTVFKNRYGKDFTKEQIACFDKNIMRAQERAVKVDPDFIMLTKICAKLSIDPNNINPYESGHYNTKTLDKIGSVAGTALAKHKNANK